MIKIENAEIWGWEHAIRGMRNPMNSWDKSDSRYIDVQDTDENGDQLKYPYSILGIMIWIL